MIHDTACCFSAGSRDRFLLFVAWIHSKPNLEEGRVVKDHGLLHNQPLFCHQPSKQYPAAVPLVPGSHSPLPEVAI